MKEQKYIMVYFMDPDKIKEDIQKISNMTTRVFFLGSTNFFVFSSTMNLDELYDYFDAVMGRLFMLTVFDENIKISLPNKIIEFLSSEEPSDVIYGLLPDDEDSRELVNSIEGSQLEYVFDYDTMQELSPSEYVKTLSDEEAEDITDEILNKMPNITPWEESIIKELLK